MGRSLDSPPAALTPPRTVCRAPRMDDRSSPAIICIIPMGFVTFADSWQGLGIGRRRDPPHGKDPRMRSGKAPVQRGAADRRPAGSGHRNRELLRPRPRPRARICAPEPLAGVDGLVRRPSISPATLQEAFAEQLPDRHPAVRGQPPRRDDGGTRHRGRDPVALAGDRHRGMDRGALADVLEQAGVDAAPRTLNSREPRRSSAAGAFGGSIPLHKARSHEVLLVWGMNGGLTPGSRRSAARAGAGYIGARSVKWLRRVRLLDGPSENHFQAVGYRLHPPQADSRIPRIRPTGCRWASWA